MWKTLLVISLTLWITHSHSQISSDCTVPSALQAAYDGDVKDLALKRMFQIQSPDTASIELIQSHQDTIWAGLAAIFNASTLMGRDSVFDMYCIHTYNSWLMTTKSIRITVDTTYAWTAAWKALQTTTGNAPLDTLLATYGFQVTFYSSFSELAYLTTTQDINTYALCDSLETFAGVIEAKSNTGGIGGGNYIYYNKVDTVQEYFFTLAYGDCPSGCIASYTWKYHVYPDCSVESVGRDDFTFGTPFPLPINCNISSCGITASFVPSSTTICVGDSITFLNSSNGTSLFEWKENGVAFSSAADVTRTFNVAGTYTISLTADTGNCMDVSSVVITVYDLPQVDLGADTSICSTCSLILDAGSGMGSYLWSLGTSSQTLIVTSADTYYVQVTDANGCIATDTIIVTIFTDLNKMEYLRQLQPFPNPTPGPIAFSGFSGESQGTIAVYNILGELVLIENMNGRIDLSNLPDGIYSLQLKYHGWTGIKKVVKYSEF